MFGTRANALGNTPYDMFESSANFYVETPLYEPNYVAPPAPPPTYIDTVADTYCRKFSQRIRIGNQVQES